MVLSVGHVERHNPVVKTAKKLISDGSWGDLITLSSRRFSNFPDRIHDVGVLFDLLIHDLDISNYLVDSQSKFSICSWRQQEGETRRLCQCYPQS